MTCDNTFSSGFWFWLGRIAAEATIAVVVIAILFAGLGLLIFLSKR